MEYKEILSNYQNRFRKYQGIMDNIVYLTSYIQIVFSRDEKVISTLLDIKSAYESVDIHILYNLLN